MLIFSLTDNAIKNLYAKIAKLETFGMKITVTRSNCQSYIGLSGIVCRDCENVFKIINPQNRIISNFNLNHFEKILIIAIPKVGSIFTLTIKEFDINLVGDYILGRTQKRLKRKLKPPNYFAKIK